MVSWSKFEIELITFGIDRGYTAKDMLPHLPRRTLKQISNKIASMNGPVENWREKYVHSCAEDLPPIAGNSADYYTRMEAAYKEYSLRWDAEIARRDAQIAEEYEGRRAIG